MSAALESPGGLSLSWRFRGLRAAAASALLAGVLLGPARADEANRRLFIQVWWDAPSVEMDPSEDPGRLEVYVGETFVGCAIAPSHLNFRKQLMIVPPSLGFMATGDASSVKVVVTGQLGVLPGRQVRVKPMDVPGDRPPS